MLPASHRHSPAPTNRPFASRQRSSGLSHHRFKNTDDGNPKLKEHRYSSPKFGMKFVLTIVLLMFGAILSKADGPAGAGPKEDILIRKAKFGKPLVWIRPKADKNESYPVDVVLRFLRTFNEGDWKAAEKLCVAATDLDAPAIRQHSAIEEKAFKLFYDRIVSSKIKEIIISEYAIKGKAGFWRVEYQLRFFSGHQKSGTISLLKEEGVWKVHERGYWHNIAKGKYTAPDWSF